MMPTGTQLANCAGVSLKHLLFVGIYFYFDKLAVKICRSVEMGKSSKPEIEGHHIGEINTFFIRYRGSLFNYFIFLFESLLEV